RRAEGPPPPALRGSPLRACSPTGCRRARASARRGGRPACPRGEPTAVGLPCSGARRTCDHGSAASQTATAILRPMTAREPELRVGPEPERGLLLAVLSKGADAEVELAELRELARTAGVEPVAETIPRRAHPDPRRYVGKGKLEELKAAYADHEAEVLLVDDELDPVQQRSLEDALSARVVDRTQLILDIFAQHATSAEGKLQVELAQLEYNLPRMRGMWK